MYGAEELGKGVKGGGAEVDVGKAATFGPHNVQSLYHSQ